MTSAVQATVAEFHDRAMELADEVLAARARGDDVAAAECAAAAFRAELAAAQLAFERRTSLATRRILVRSAAFLAHNAIGRRIRPADRMTLATLYAALDVERGEPLKREWPKRCGR